MDELLEIGGDPIGLPKWLNKVRDVESATRLIPIMGQLNNLVSGFQGENER